jgi:uncharacterized protein with PIN domain
MADQSPAIANAPDLPAQEHHTPQKALFRFYGPLNDFLEPGQRHQDLPYPFKGRPSIKHALEALGVPHPEVDLALVDGAPVAFDYLLRDGDRASIYPPFTGIDIGGLSRVRPAPLPEARFVLDNHLGKLAAYLRMLGFDSLYRNDFDDVLLAQLASEDGRILLTRDRGLLMRSLVTHGYWLRSKDPRLQLREVVVRFDLAGRAHPFRRCLRCNGLLQPVSKGQVNDRLEPKTRLYYEEFFQCPDCRQVYWRGSHFERMQRFIDAVLSE